MIPGRGSFDSNENRFLVAEQPGLLLSLSAILVALFLGLAFRASFSPERITALLQEGAQKIHPDLQVQFESASLSLSDGFFPELAVVVQNIQGTSESECWMKPQLRIDTLRMPLSLLELFHGQVRLNTVEVENADLQLRSERRDCGNVEASSGPEGSEPAASPRKTASEDKNKQDEVQVAQRNPVENVFVRSLRVQFPGENANYFELRRVSVHSKSDLKWLVAEGRLLLPAVSLAGAQALSDFRVKVENSNLNLKVEGYWREGHYRFDSNLDLKTNLATAQIEAQHLPLNPVMALIQKRGWMDRDLDARRAWLSFQGELKDPQPLTSAARVQIRNFKIEGDLGEIESQEFEIRSLSPLEPGPVTFAMRGVQLEQMLRLFGLSHPSPVLGELGSFNGVWAVQNKENFELAGEHSGLQFIFSNRGVREAQTLSLIGGRAQFNKGQWKVEINRVRPLEGLFLGRVNIKANAPWDQVDLQLHLDELTLSPAVQKLMTGGGSLGRWSGDLGAQLRKGQLAHLKGQLFAEDLVLENLSIQKGQVLLRGETSQVALDLQGKRLELQAPSPLLDALGPFLASQAAYQSDLARLQIELPSATELKWKLSPLRIGSVQLKSTGGWKTSGELFGEITQTESNRTRLFQIQGTRDVPQFIESRTQ